MKLGLPNPFGSPVPLYFSESKFEFEHGIGSSEPLSEPEWLRRWPVREAGVGAIGARYEVHCGTRSAHSSAFVGIASKFLRVRQCDTALLLKNYARR